MKQNLLFSWLKQNVLNTLVIANGVVIANSGCEYETRWKKNLEHYNQEISDEVQSKDYTI